MLIAVYLSGQYMFLPGFVVVSVAVENLCNVLSFTDSLFGTCCAVYLDGFIVVYF